MGNLIVRAVMVLVGPTDGPAMAPSALYEELAPFVRELRDLEPGTAGFPLVSYEELTRFVASAEQRDNRPVASVTRAIPVDTDRWMLVPDDDDREDGPGLDFQSFEFVERAGRILFVPTAAEITVPTSPGELQALFAASRATGLWEAIRLKKDAAVCVDTDSGDCYGDECASGCGKLTWGPPDAPMWSCVCPDA